MEFDLAMILNTFVMSEIICGLAGSAHVLSSVPVGGRPCAPEDLSKGADTVRKAGIR